MALVTYSSEPHSLGFICDDARFACLADTGDRHDPRRRGARRPT